MSYENAPATKMLNTHCAACARPLVDAESVTAGLGPHCRAKHGLPRSLPADVRERANKLVFQCASLDVPAEVLRVAVVELSLLGCSKLAERIAKRAGRVCVTITDDAVDVTAPYSESFLQNRGPGRWIRSDKVTRYRHADALRALEAVCTGFGCSVLVRYTCGGQTNFFNANDPKLAHAMRCTVDCAESESESETEAVEVAHAGSPSKMRDGGWGVCLPSDATAEPGQLVVVRTKSGKAWVAKLVACDSRPRWGQVWATERTQHAVPADAPAPAPRESTPAPASKRWSGRPTKVNGEWGVAIARTVGDDDASPRAGDTVRIHARSGKSWTATLGCDAWVNRYGDWTATTVRR